MKRMALVVGVLCVFVGNAYALPKATLEYGTVPLMESRLEEDQCRLGYYNICSGWILHQYGYCVGSFDDAPLPAMYGTCFDLSDCASNCRHLDDVWWACKHFIIWGTVDVQVFPASNDACPIGPPLAALYGVAVQHWDPWQHFDFGGFPLCTSEETGSGKFIIMITEYPHHPQWGRAFATQADINSYNIDAGCESDWRCQGHSYVYRNFVSYCDVYGAPGPTWGGGADYGCMNAPPIPPGCHDYWPTGFYTEWLIHCYLSCQGPTQTERKTWSAVKSLYR